MGYETAICSKCDCRIFCKPYSHHWKKSGSLPGEKQDCEHVPKMESNKVKNQKARWFCRLCQSYDVKSRVRHLIDKHGLVTDEKMTTYYKPIVEFVFNEVHT